MRAAPPLTLSVTRYGGWRCLLLLLAAGVWTAMAGWWSAQPEPVPNWANAAAALGALAAVCGVATLWRQPSLTLHWDRQRWHLAGATEQTGGLAVAIDLGAWMLVRFVPDALQPVPRKPRWIALQRRGLEPHWHGLRCALYSPRAASKSDADAGDG